MKILNADQLKAVDAFTIKHKPISSIELMEDAAKSCFHWIVNHYSKAFNFLIFCGTGNNGGDGLAIGRMLIDAGYQVEVFQLTSEHFSHDNLDNQHRYQKHKPIHLLLNDGIHTSFINSKTIIIDALFGYGLNRPVEGLSAKVIRQLNEIGAPIISIDLPSGMFCDDNRSNELTNIIRATHTLSFEFPKLAFMLPDSGKCVGNLHLLSIGILSSPVESQESNYHYIDVHVARQKYRARHRFSHKGTFGHALLIGGSYGKMGSISLSAKAALRSGAGLVSVMCPKVGVSIVQTTIPEAMIISNPGEEYLHLAEVPQNLTIGIGPGIGISEETVSFVLSSIEQSISPLVIDADALNILSMNKEWLKKIPSLSIITPHVKEFDRLFGKSSSSLDRLLLAKAKSTEYDVIIVLKGMHSAVIFPNGQVFFNSTGNPGMATGGSGDVLTGILTGLIASGYSVEESAVLGVFLHGLSADLAVMQGSEEALIASDIIANLELAFQEVGKNNWNKTD